MATFRYDAVIFTLTDQIAEIEYLITTLPDVKFTIAAPVYFSEKIQKLAIFKNVALETIFNHEKIAYLMDKGDVLLDISHGDELYDACERFKEMGKEILGFDTTVHKHEGVKVFSQSSPEELVAYMQGINPLVSQNKIDAIWFDGDFNRKQVNPNAKLLVGHNVIGRSFSNFSISGQLYIEQNVFFNNYCSFNCLDRIEIGEDTMIGEGVKFYDHDHTFSKEQIDKWHYKSAPIVVGKKCWIGSNVTILKGVTIGDNVVIGAGCLIRRDIPANTIVYNNGEVIIKER